MILQFVYPWLASFGTVIVGVIGWWRWTYYKYPTYRYALAAPFKKAYARSNKSLLMRSILFILRLLLLMLLLFSVARLRYADGQSKLPVEGVDILLVLDISGSMKLFDDLHDRRTRLEVAKTEAVKFIEKRPYDQIGLVEFGNIAALQCPLTQDKKLLTEIIQGDSDQALDTSGTVLCRALATAAQHLDMSKARSKIVIALTDGVPSERDIPVRETVDLIKKFGIKVYTIGIGSEKGGYIMTPVGLQQSITPLNKDLLRSIAKETGGQFFQARNAQEVEKIYNLIDKLEKTDYETPLFANYHDTIMPILGAVLIGIVSEILAMTFMWVAL
jgi:Ca-activated chloride channel homolog